MALASRPTHRKGRRWLLLGVLATVVVLAVNAAMSARSPAPARQLAQQSYVDQILPAIQDSTQQGRDIDMVRQQAHSLSATTITSRLGQVAGAARQTLRAVQRLTPPKPSQTAHDLLIAALAIRVQGAEALTQALGGALSSGQDPTSAVNALVDVGQDFSAADRAYALFVQAAPTSGTPLAPSRWVNDSATYASTNLSVYLTSLRSAASLTPVHDTAIVVVTTDPSPVSVNGDTQILPVNRALQMQVVVANQGNEPEKNLTVSATIAPSANGPSQMVRDFVDLTPGQTKTVSLGTLRVVPNQPTTLTVKIDTVPGETNVSNNSKTITLMMQQ
jgi:hypothetical protein